MKTEQEWIEEYERRGALWIHDENMRRPHVKLRSGLHSNGFFNSRKVIPTLKDTSRDEEKYDLLNEAAADLLNKLKTINENDYLIQGIIGPQTGATELARLMSEHFVMRYGNPCFWASPAKHEENGVITMVFDEEDQKLLRGKVTLTCEDVWTTGGSVMRTEDAALNYGALPTNYACCVVNRSGKTEVNGRIIVSLINKAMPQWSEEECPYCKEGSEVISDVKDPENWKRLIAEY